MINYITAPFKWFFKLEAASGLLLLIAAVIALIISNSDFGEDYFNLLNTHILIGTESFGLNLIQNFQNRLICVSLVNQNKGH